MNEAGTPASSGKRDSKILAEGVNGQDLQAARRLERLGEQTPRLLQFFRTAEVGADVCDFLRQLGIRQHRPLAKLTEQAVLHLRRCGLGEGEAQDFRGLGIGQQQARHAIGERVRLAGAGVGGHPGRLARIGGGNRRIRAHSSASSQPPSDHSRTRLRWS